MKFEGVSPIRVQVSPTYFNEMKRECIEELVRNQHGVYTIRRGNILDGVVPMQFEAAFAIPCAKFLLLNSSKSRT
jgi:hypothetical protein